NRRTERAHTAEHGRAAVTVAPVAWASVRPAACRRRAWVARLVAATALDRVAAPRQGGVNLRPPAEPHREAASPGPRPAEPHHEAAKSDRRAAARLGGGSPDHRVGEHHQAARIRKHPVPARHAAANPRRAAPPGHDPYAPRASARDRG